MYYRVKNTLKNNYNHTFKEILYKTNDLLNLKQKCLVIR